jgi:hypothetical protein
MVYDSLTLYSFFLGSVHPLIFFNETLTSGSLLFCRLLTKEAQNLVDVLDKGVLISP